MCICTLLYYIRTNIKKCWLHLGVGCSGLGIVEAIQVELTANLVVFSHLFFHEPQIILSLFQTHHSAFPQSIVLSVHGHGTCVYQKLDRAGERLLLSKLPNSMVKNLHLCRFRLSYIVPLSIR